MFIVPTKSRFKSESNSNTPRAISHSGKSRAEIQILGERMRYQDRELSAKDVASLGADEFLWFETFHPERLEQAAQIEKNKREYKETKPKIDARRMWQGSATEEETAAAHKAGTEFV